MRPPLVSRVLTAEGSYEQAEAYEAILQGIIGRQKEVLARGRAARAAGLWNKDTHMAGLYNQIKGYSVLRGSTKKRDKKGFVKADTTHQVEAGAATHIRVPGGWGMVRRLQGLQTDYVDLNFSGYMMSHFMVKGSVPHAGGRRGGDRKLTIDFMSKTGRMYTNKWTFTDRVILQVGFDDMVAARHAYRLRDSQDRRFAFLRPDESNEIALEMSALLRRSDITGRGERGRFTAFKRTAGGAGRTPGLAGGAGRAAGRLITVE